MAPSTSATRTSSRQTGLPKATVSRLTFTLAALGYLNYSASQEKYSLGTAVLSLGHAFMKGNDVLSSRVRSCASLPTTRSRP